MNLLNKYIEVNIPAIEISDVNYWPTDAAYLTGVSKYIAEFGRKADDALIDGIFLEQVAYERARLDGNDVSHFEFEDRVGYAEQVKNFLKTVAHEARNCDGSTQSVQALLQRLIQLNIFLIREADDRAEELDRHF